MFAKPRTAAAFSPAFAGGAPPSADGFKLPPALAAVLEKLSNPFVGAGSAAALFLLAAAGLIVATANPHAGAPKVRVSLEQGGDPSKVPGLRPGQMPDPLAGPGLSLDALAPGQEVALPGASAGADPGASPGEAVFILPQGGSVAGGAATSAPGAPAATADTAPARPLGPPLPKAPLAGLSAPGPGGPLPVIAKDGRSAFSAYRRPFADNGKPKIALVVGGLGLNAAATRSAIERLPAEVTLSFVPYADGLQGWIDQARAAGHEVMLEIPMEPIDYPNNDPGPQTLLSSAPAADMLKRLEWLLARGQGYFGVSNYLGGRFVTADKAMGVFGAALKARGLAFIDDGSAQRKGGAYARASADAVIDEQLSAEQIDKSLLGLEAAALKKGSALGTGFAYPVTVEQVTRWARNVTGRGYQLAPASAVAHR